MFMGKSFSESQIKREIEIVKQEINLLIDSVADSETTALDVLFNGLTKPSNAMNSFELIGNGRTLNQIKPEHLNLVIHIQL